MSGSGCCTKFGAALRQLRLLLWKNFTIQRRAWIWTLLEILLPVLFCATLVLVGQIVSEKSHKATHFKPFDVTGNLEIDSGIDPLNFEDKLDPDGFLNFENCFMPTRLAYAPKNNVTSAIMKRVSERMGNLHFNITVTVKGYKFPVNITLPSEPKGFESTDAMENFLYAYFQANTGASPASLPPCGYNLTDITNSKYNMFFGGIVFDLNDPSVIRYTVRLSNTARNLNQHKTAAGGAGQNAYDNAWDTSLSFPLLDVPGPRDGSKAQRGTHPGYWGEGFLTVQRAVDYGITRYFFEARANRSMDPAEIASLEKMLNDADVELQRYPYPAYVDNPFVQIIQGYLPSVLMVSYCVSVLYVSRNIVIEKEHRLKEYMKIMGLKSWLYWPAHFLSNFSILVIVAGIITVLLTVSFGGKTLVALSDPSIVFVHLTLFSISTIFFAFAVSVCFQKGSMAAGCAFVSWFVCYLPYVFLNSRYGTLTLDEKLGSCILMPTGMAFGAYVLGVFEGNGEGLQWATLNTPGTPDDNLTMFYVWLMLVFDCALCAFITWYGSNVNPGDDGVARKWYFPFQISYWRCCDTAEFQNEVDPLELEKTFCASKNFDTEPTDRRADVVIFKLMKIFGGRKSTKVAVNNLSLRMYNGQITALLGHNGAGKSTTLSMLTGLLSATSGRALIRGFDVSTQMDQIRTKMGFCPQYNVLFDNLTVYEHLEFFCKLKNRPFSKSEAEELIEKISLTPKRNVFSKNLSGGMKRKLSMAISLIGRSEVVLLDEPTSGMDPGARHETWQLLQSEKANRTLLLTTHYMEEADLLGDRIAIMAKGQLQCCGSSLFLKNRYGAGYHVTCVFGGTTDRNSVSNIYGSRGSLSTPTPKSISYDLDLDKASDAGGVYSTAVIQDLVKGLIKVVRKHCPDAALDSSIGAECTILLPNDDKKKFPVLFAELEDKQRSLGISSFGVSLTTMEEVFLKVAEENQKDAHKDGLESNGSINTNHGYIDDDNNISPDGITLSTNVVFNSTYRNEGFTLFAQQLFAMIIKRARLNWRNIWLLVAQIVVPVVVIVAALLINGLLPGAKKEPPLTLNLDPFAQAQIYIGYEAGPHGNISEFPPEVSLTEEFANAIFAQESDGAGMSKGYHDWIIPIEQETDWVQEQNTEANIFKGISPKFYARFPKFQQQLQKAAHKLGVNFDDLEKIRKLLAAQPIIKNLEDKFKGPALKLVTALTNDPVFVEALNEFPARFTRSADSDPAPYQSLNRQAWWARTKGLPAHNASGLNDKLVSLQSLKTGVGSNKFTLHFPMSGWFSLNNDASPQPENSVFDETVDDRISENSNSSEIAKLLNSGKSSARKSTNPTGNKLSVVGYFNDQALHTPAITLNYVDNAIFRYFMNATGSNDVVAPRIETINHPLPPTKYDELQNWLATGAKEFQIAFNMAFGMSFLSAGFVVFLVTERVTGAKHLQFLSGIKAFTYWLALFLWDLFSFHIPVAFIMISFKGFNVEELSGSEWWQMYLLLLFYGIAVIPQVYCASFIFSEATGAFVMLVIVNIITGS